MTSFETISPDRPLRVVVAGAGNMGRLWIGAVLDNPDVELHGIADAVPAAAEAAAAQLGLKNCALGADAVELAQQIDADALIDVTIPAAHHPVTAAALHAGIPVLGEKPAAATVAEALSLAATSEATGQLFVVSQSRRYNPNVFALRDAALSLGQVGFATVSFFRAPRFGGFRDTMAHPLLLDMAIHPFDSARFLLGSEPVSVRCEEFSPAWSWYEGDAAVSATFEMDDGARFSYNASWCSPGLETSWNGEWRLSGSGGTAVWDGENLPRVESDGEAAPTSASVRPSIADGIAGSLSDFVRALRTGNAPMGEIHENVMSLLMVDAAVAASESDTRVLIDELLEKAHGEALAAERDEATRAILDAWSSPREALVAF